MDQQQMLIRAYNSTTRGNRNQRVPALRGNLSTPKVSRRAQKQ